MQDFPISPKAMVASLWVNRDLIKTLIRREVVGRYRGSILGILWSFFHPLFLLGVYTFVFSTIFKARWSTGSDSKTEFALVLFSGLLVFNIFADCFNRAPGLILANVNYVKKVVFPLEILPWVAMGTALFHGLVGLSVWIGFYMVFFGLPHQTIMLFPMAILPLVFFTMGLSWLLASLGVYLRDVGQVIGVLTTALLFLSAIFYPLTRLPKNYQKLLYFNPLVVIIEQTRDVLIWGRLPDVRVWFGYLFGGLVMAWLGFAWFQKTRKGFADVL